MLDRKSRDSSHKTQPKTIVAALTRNLVRGLGLEDQPDHLLLHVLRLVHVLQLLTVHPSLRRLDLQRAEFEHRECLLLGRELEDLIGPCLVLLVALDLGGLLACAELPFRRGGGACDL